jgi:hypothetical protein
MEMQAYDCLSMDYYYTGNLEKSKFYHDRIARGKFENDTSIMKKVTCNLLKSRRDQRHIERDNGFTAGQKIKSEMQRLPSPSNLSKGSSISKAVSLLPHFTEAQAAGIYDEADTQGKGVRDSKSSSCSRRPARFTMQELMYLNNPPKTDYIKCPVDKSK